MPNCRAEITKREAPTWGKGELHGADDTIEHGGNYSNIKHGVYNLHIFGLTGARSSSREYKGTRRGADRGELIWRARQE